MDEDDLECISLWEFPNLVEFEANFIQCMSISRLLKAGQTHSNISGGLPITGFTLNINDDDYSSYIYVVHF